MITIPESELMQTIAKLDRQRAEALALLHELEAAYAKRTLTEKPGGWRQNPQAWQRRVRSS